VRIEWPLANVGGLAEDEWRIAAIGIDPDGRPGDSYVGLPPIGSVPECDRLRGDGEAGPCVECLRLADVLHPGESVECIKRFAMPATVQSGLIHFDTDHGDQSVTRFTISN